MITIKNKIAREKMTVAGKLLAEVFCLLDQYIIEGVSTHEVDLHIAKLLAHRKLVSQTKGFGTYKHVSCISVNDEVVHGVPSKDKTLIAGDLVKVDVCAAYNGYCADMTRCFFVQFSNEEAKKLVAVAQDALNSGIAHAVPGRRLGDISSAIQKVIEKAGFGVVRDFAGHGIGKRMHEEPEILNYGEAGTGLVLRPGMAFALEPMITYGHFATYVMPDGWTAKTKDGSLVAHVEDTVLVTENGPYITTRLA